MPPHTHSKQNSGLTGTSSSITDGIPRKPKSVYLIAWPKVEEMLCKQGLLKLA